MLESFPERQVDQFLELHTRLLRSIESLQRGSDIIVEGNCSSHASKHNVDDALMQFGRFANDVWPMP